MIKQSVALQLAGTLCCGALCGACAAQVDDESSDPIAQTQSALNDGVGATFEQVLNHNVPTFNKVTQVCEMTIPDVDPLAGTLTIQVRDSVDGQPGPVNVTQAWTGSDISLAAVGKPKDTLVVSGCTAASEAETCRLKIRLTTKGNPHLSDVGCEIEVTGSVSHHGLSTGSQVESYNGGMTPGALLRAQGRQKMLLSTEDSLLLAHQCTARTYNAAPEAILGGHKLWINGVAAQPDMSYEWDSPVPPFGALADFTPFAPVGRYGRDLVSTKIKPIIPHDGSLTPGDYVWCDLTVADGTEVEHSARLNVADQPPTSEQGMMFQ